MQILGLIISILFYLLLIVIMGVYVFFFFMKKYNYANWTIRLLFFHSLITIMVLSWALVLMNGGFDVNFYLNIDYTWLLIPFSIIFIIINTIDALLQKKIEIKQSPPYIIGRFLLPGSVVLIACLSTLILFFNCHYFVYLLI